MLNFGPLGSGVGQGFPRWFEVIERRAIEMIEMSGPVLGLFFCVFNGGSDYGDFVGAPGTVYAYGLP